MDELGGAVACRGPEQGIARYLILLIVARLRRFAVRFARLAIHGAAKPRPPVPERIVVGRRAPLPRLPDPLPRRFGWLLRLLPATDTLPVLAGIARWQIQRLVEDPEFLALLAATPALGRILRPLCVMLGISLPPELRLVRRRRQKPPSPDADPPEPAPAPASAPPMRHRTLVYPTIFMTIKHILPKLTPDPAHDPPENPA